MIHDNYDSRQQLPIFSKHMRLKIPQRNWGFRCGEGQPRDDNWFSSTPVTDPLESISRIQQSVHRLKTTFSRLLFSRQEGNCVQKIKNSHKTEKQELPGSETPCFLRPLHFHVVICLPGVSKWPKPAAGCTRGDWEKKWRIVHSILASATIPWQRFCLSPGEDEGLTCKSIKSRFPYGCAPRAKRRGSSVHTVWNSLLSLQTSCSCFTR